MLTQKQKDLLLFINDRLRENGVPPSFDEMKDALDLKSKSGIHRLITALEERGFIRRLKHRARALEVLKLPGSDTAPVEEPSGPHLQVIEGGAQSGPRAPRSIDNDCRQQNGIRTGYGPDCGRRPDFRDPEPYP